MTQQQLADAMGLRHRQTVAAIETGDRRLRAEELILSMTVLGVDLDYLTDPFRLVGEGQFSFRTSVGVEEDALDRFEQRAGRWIAMYRELSREQGHPPRWLGYKLNLSDHSSFEDAQAAGEAVVDLWELGARPAERLRSAMEDQLHMMVLYVDTPPGISGAASRVPGLNCALVNRRESEGQRNFDLAHELFHLLTWDALPPERVVPVAHPPRGKRWRAERLAENFASALLMPESTMMRAWAARAGTADVHERLNEIAGEIGVSSQACKWRLRNLGLFESGAGGDRRGDASCERWLGVRTGEVPSFSGDFIGVVANALESGRLSVKRVASLLGVSVTRLAQILRGYGHEMYFEA